MKKSILSIARRLDETVSAAYGSFFDEKSALIAFLVHGLFRDRKEIAINHVLPQQEMTVSVFRQFVEYFLEHDYIFVSPDRVLTGLEMGKRYALITFDDGYYNNSLALPILRQYEIPAIFFVSSGHITRNICFWWDVVYRERLRRHTSIEQIEREIGFLKRQKTSEIENYVEKNFGAKAFHPLGDIDRPFNSEELRAFSQDPFVSIGNHTLNHAILSNCSYSEIQSEIAIAQKSIVDMTGISPTMISYPNGDFTGDVVPILKSCGIKLGITVSGLKNYLPLDLSGNNAFLLNRFIVWGNRDLVSQCASFRSDIQILGKLRKVLKERSHENSMPY